MTRSAVDGHITIEAWANDEATMPRSMLMRADDESLYDRTETAKVYRSARTAMRIVEDTSAAPDYAELYEGQLDEIRSSLIYPILSTNHDLLGTLVVHCDQAGFFRRDAAAFWKALLAGYARRIALEKVRLESRSGPGSWRPPPPAGVG